MTIDISFRTQNNLPVLQLAGRLSDADSDAMSQAITSLQRENSPVVVLDISNLAFIDSQGLGRLVSLNAAMTGEKRRLLILNTNPDPDAFVPSLLFMTNLAKVLTIVKSLDEI